MSDEKQEADALVARLRTMNIALTHDAADLIERQQEALTTERRVTETFCRMRDNAIARTETAEAALAAERSTRPVTDEALRLGRELDIARAQIEDLQTACREYRDQRDEAREALAVPAVPTPEPQALPCGHTHHIWDLSTQRGYKPGASVSEPCAAPPVAPKAQDEAALVEQIAVLLSEYVGDGGAIKPAALEAARIIVRRVLLLPRAPVPAQDEAPEALVETLDMLCHEWMQCEDRSADYQDGLADAADEVRALIFGYPRAQVPEAPETL